MALKQLDQPTIDDSYWPPPQGEWTYEDYARLPDNGFRYEVKGVPDLVIEVLSPGTARYDRKTKFEVYAEAGVSEYWLAEPNSFTIEVYVLRGQAYALLGKFGREEQTRSEVLPDFTIPVKDVFRY